MDIPKWSYWLINRDAGHNVMKIGVLEFFGMKPEKISVFSGIKSSDDIKRNSGLKKLWNQAKIKNNNKKVFSIFNQKTEKLIEKPVVICQIFIKKQVA